MTPFSILQWYIKVYSFFNTPCSSIAEIVSAHASGKIASLITVESGHSIGTSLAVLRMFHRLGARSLTLTHNCNTPWYVIIKVIFIRSTITISVILLLLVKGNAKKNDTTIVKMNTAGCRAYRYLL